MNDTRFFKRKCLLIGFETFERVMQEITGDKTVEIEKDYPVLSCYSRENDYAYDEDEIKDMIGNYLSVSITAVMMLSDLEEIYFIEGGK